MGKSSKSSNKRAISAPKQQKVRLTCQQRIELARMRSKLHNKTLALSKKSSNEKILATLFKNRLLGQWKKSQEILNVLEDAVKKSEKAISNLSSSNDVSNGLTSITTSAGGSGSIKNKGTNDNHNRNEIDPGASDFNFGASAGGIRTKCTKALNELRSLNEAVNGKYSLESYDQYCSAYDQQEMLEMQELESTKGRLVTHITAMTDEENRILSGGPLYVRAVVKPSTRDLASDQNRFEKTKERHQQHTKQKGGSGTTKTSSTHKSKKSMSATATTMTPKNKDSNVDDQKSMNIMQILSDMATTESGNKKKPSGSWGGTKQQESGAAVSSNGGKTKTKKRASLDRMEIDSTSGHGNTNMPEDMKIDLSQKNSSLTGQTGRSKSKHGSGHDRSSKRSSHGGSRKRRRDDHYQQQTLSQTTNDNNSEKDDDTEITDTTNNAVSAGSNKKVACTIIPKAPKMRKCHICKDMKLNYRRCHYYNSTGIKCSRAYCLDCLHEYGDNGKVIDGNEEDWHCPACLGVCRCPACAKREKKMKTRVKRLSSRSLRS